MSAKKLLVGHLVRHPLEPLPGATLRAGMQRGMIYREQVRCRSRRLIRGHREEDAPLGTSRVSVNLSGVRRWQVRWSLSTAGVHPHETPACRSAWDDVAADKRLISPNPRAPRPAAPPPRLWSAPLGPPCPACAAVPSVSRWRVVGARAPLPPPNAPRRGGAHSLPPAPGHRA